MKLKIPLPSFERKHHQHSGILRNRYVIDMVYVPLQVSNIFKKKEDK